MAKLQPGGVAQNRISDNSVVYVRRDAELTVNKTWEEGDGEEKIATFQLIGPKGNIDIIDTAKVTGNDSATLYIGADKLSEVIILAPSAKPLRRAANTLRGRIKRS